MKTPTQIAAATAKRLATAAANRAAGVLPVHKQRVVDRAARAAARAEAEAAFAAPLADEVRRQAERILMNLRAFQFEQGGYWQAAVRSGEFETGWTPRVAGSPIFDTIGQVAGVYASRAEVEEAAAAVVDRRMPALRRGLLELVPAIEAIAAALAAGSGRVACLGGAGTEPIPGLADLEPAALEDEVPF